MTFKDIFKKDFLDKFNNENITTTTILIYLGMAIIMGLFIYLIYRLSSKSGFYSHEFNKSLAILPVITAGIILAMGSSLTISLGMVGALSIVRFRNAIKDTVDLVYLFWSISAGIVVGSGLFELAIILSLILAACMMLLDFIPVLRAPGVLVISATCVDIETDLIEIISNFSKGVKIRSRNVSKKGTEWIYEIRTQNEQELLQKVSEIEEVVSVHLMTHDGEIRL